MKLKGNILVLTQWSFKDALVQTYTLPYVDIIRNTIPANQKIFVVTSEQERIALEKDETDTINAKWKERNMVLVAQSYRRFGLRKMLTTISRLFALRRLIIKENINVIHAFCTPAGSLGYILSKLTGKALVIDSYEPHAEPMVETGTWKKQGIAFKILFWFEKQLSVRAKYIIGTTVGMKNYAKEKYGAELKNFFIKPACIDLDVFFPVPKNELLLNELGLTNKIVCVYAGKLGGTYLKDEVFDFVKNCFDHWGNRFRFLMLSGETDQEIAEQTNRVHIPADVVVKRFVFHHEIPRYLSLGDFAINPQVPVPSKRFGAPIKNGEYWAMGLPVIISPGVSDDSDIIAANRIGVVINLQKKENMPEAVRKIDELLLKNKREELQQRIFEVAKKYRSFEIARKIYPMIYES
jgi:glycosyltransferase involved in cell wall biosynthesis